MGNERAYVNDIIPGAKYRDGALGKEFHCNGIVVDPDENRKVRVEYLESGATLSIPYDVFQEEPMFEIVEQP